MPLRRLPDSEFQVLGRESRCPHPDHEPPSHILLEPGNYQHDCPGCGAVTIFTVDERARMG